MKKIAILGSTGSIGRQTLDVAREQKDIEVVALCARRSVDLMEAQIREFRPRRAVMWEEDAAADLRARVRDLDVEVLSGMEGILDTASMDGYEYFVTAIMGMVGVRPTVAAIESGKKIALANKETLVTAGHIIMPLAAEKGVPILPVDSEHSAIFQSLNGESGNKIAKIWLTASGGPFRGRTAEEIRNMRPEDALKHPTWEMGQKITIDSSTLVNKGLEVLEAAWLFHVPVDQIQVVVQPQSIVHSAVQYVDGSVKAQLGLPDMRIPIEYALYAPDRRALPDDERLDLAKLGSLTFENPDLETFKGLALGYRAGRTGGSMPTVFNAANEEAVALFLDDRIDFLEIADVIEEAMNAHENHVISMPTLQEILDTEAWARSFVREHSTIVH
jgi:1-deoxy-D-xylulose-5-phosphate reductoisomerase